MFPAKNGDSFLIRESQSPQAGSILVDGGFDCTYSAFIAPELEALRQQGAALDLVIVTHIDADHISGVLSLLKANGPNSSAHVIKVNHVWHNSLRSITSVKHTSPTAGTDQAILSVIRARGYPNGFSASSSAHEISGRQGSSLAALLHGGNYLWNGSDGSVSITAETATLAIGQSMQVHVLGPATERLEALRTSWIRELRRIGVLGTVTQDAYFDDAFEFMAAAADQDETPGVTEIAHRGEDHRTLTEAYNPDPSPNNGSSISVLIETPSARMLFLGDAWADDTVVALERRATAGVMTIFDAIKLSHHGSCRNTSPQLLELIDAPVYLISSDGGKHGHPDFPVLRAIVDRPSTFIRHLYFNYATAASTALRTHQSTSGAQFVVHENFHDWITVGKSN